MNFQITGHIHFDVFMYGGPEADILSKTGHYVANMVKLITYNLSSLSLILDLRMKESSLNW